MHANWTGTARGGSAVCVQFAYISPIAPALWIAHYFFSLICTSLVAAKAAQSFSESGPESRSISLWPGTSRSLQPPTFPLPPLSTRMPTFCAFLKFLKWAEFALNLGFSCSLNPCSTFSPLHNFNKLWCINMNKN